MATEGDGEVLIDDLPSDADLAAVATAVVEQPAAVAPPVVAPAAPEAGAAVPAPAAPSPSEPAAPVEPAAGDPPVEPAAPAAPVADERDEFGVPKRFYTGKMTPQQKALLGAMMANPDATPEEAVAIANRKLGIAPAAEPAPGEERTGVSALPSEAVDPLAEAEAELARLDSELEDAADLGGVGSVFNKDIKQKLDRVTELRVQIPMLKQQAEAEARSIAEQIRSVEEQHSQQVVERYPDFERADSPATLRATQHIQELEALAASVRVNPALAQNPLIADKLAIFRSPEFPSILAEKVARELNLQPVIKSVQAQPGGQPGATSTTSQPTQGGYPAATNQRQAQPAMVPVSGGNGASHRVVISPVAVDPMSKFAEATKNVAADDLDGFMAATDAAFFGGGAAGVADETGGRVRIS